MSCDLPDLPYVGHLPGHEVPSLIVFLGGPDGTPAPHDFRGYFCI